MKSPFRVNPDI